VPIYARARDVKHLLDLKKAGATDATLEKAETSLQLGSKMLKGLGMMSDDVSFLSQLVRDSMELQAEEANSQREYRESNIMEPLQVRVADIRGPRIPVATTTPKSELSVQNQKDRASLSTIQKEADPEEQDYELNQAVKLEGNGASYSKQDIEESSAVGSQDDLGK
ncbi:K(+) efflux antiporter 3 chloroplastic-like, partial [Trifolium medium]|nr:K(+) efflux antiporter 3 chloroplastic-like [Trifolium medium]